MLWKMIGGVTMNASFVKLIEYPWKNRTIKLPATARWAAQDQNGLWFWYEDEPFIEGGVWKPYGRYGDLGRLPSLTGAPWYDSLTWVMQS